MLPLIGQKSDAYSSSSMNNCTRDISREEDGPIRASMPPPPVAMAASKLRIKTLEEQLKQKDKIIHEFEAANRSQIALAAEKAKNRELAQMNKGWRKHNASPYTPQLYRSERTTEDEIGNVKTEKVVFVTEYRFAMEKIERMNAEAGKAKDRALMCRAEQKDAYLKTQELIKVAEKLRIKIARERMRIAKSAPEEDQVMTTTDGNTADSDGDVNMIEPWTATTAKSGRLVLHLPKRNIRPTRLRLGQPKLEKSWSVQEAQPTRLRLSQPRAEKVGEGSDRVRSGRVPKASAKARK